MSALRRVSAFALETYENLGHSHTLEAADCPTGGSEQRLPRRAQAIARGHGGRGQTP